jgi:threonine dehydrogenase-like Zn-dependent dehydrogenase
MRAFVVNGPHSCSVEEVDPPVAAPGEVVVAVERVGVCGTDAEFYSGKMTYLHDGQAHYPIRLGHEWCGTVVEVGAGVDPAWLGRRTTGDTMLGCGHCYRCHSGRHHVCEDRFELGIRRGRPGALAEQVAVPASSLHALPDSVDGTAGALVEPGGNALRAIDGAQLSPRDRLLILGAGTIGLLAAQFALAQKAEVHVVDRSSRALTFARTLGVHGAWPIDDVPDLPFDAVVDASNGPESPARAIELVEPGKRVVLIGLAGSASLVDTRTLVLKDVTVVGILSGSHGLAGAIRHYAAGTVDPRPLVAATIGLAELGAVLDGTRPSDAGPGPKIHVDPLT